MIIIAPLCFQSFKDSFYRFILFSFEQLSLKTRFILRLQHCVNQGEQRHLLREIFMLCQAGSEVKHLCDLLTSACLCCYVFIHLFQKYIWYGCYASCLLHFISKSAF